MRNSSVALFLIGFLAFLLTSCDRHAEQVVPEKQTAEPQQSQPPVIVATPTPDPAPSPTPTPIAKQATPMPTPVIEPNPISWLLEKKSRWPSDVTLSEPAEFHLVVDGKSIGSAKVPRGTIVRLVSLDLKTVSVLYGGKPNTLPINHTDLAVRARKAMLSDLASGQKTIPNLLKATASLAKPSFSSRALHAVGKNLEDKAGKIVVLRGVNIGGWLVTEGWMCGQTDSNERTALEQMEARFGTEKASELINAWYDNWFTAADLDAIQSYGFNLIRVPFSYRNFQNANGEWIRGKNGEIDFSRLDWIVSEAGKRDIYVIPDLHCWPGEYGMISRATDEGEQIRGKMSELWKQLALHFKGNGNIAGFDVINEPEGSPGDLPHRAFYDTIRSVDPERMLIMEWTDVQQWTAYGWENVVVSDHYPESEAKEIPDSEAEKRLDGFVEKATAKSPNHFDHPVFIGETKALQDNSDSARALVEAYKKRGWSWAVWTYKGVSVGGWAGFNYHGSLKYDMTTVSYEELKYLWSEQLSQWQNNSGAPNYYLTDWWIEGFSQH